MTFARMKTSRRMRDRLRRHGLALGYVEALLLGPPFLAFGVKAILVGLGEPKGDACPPVVSLGAGITFTLAGLFICLRVLRRLLRKYRWHRLAKRHPDQPWFADYPWESTGASDHAARKLLRPFGITGFLFVFLIPFNYFTFSGGGNGTLWFFKALVGLFDAAFVASFGYALYCLGRYLRYGSASLQFNGFPFFLGGRLDVQVAPPEKIRDFSSMEVTLRCIEERVTDTSTNPNIVRCYEVYADTVRIEGGARSNTIPIAFDLPVNAPSTALAKHLPAYWEIEVTADVPGIDYRTSFLLPVYTRPEVKEPTP